MAIADVSALCQNNLSNSLKNKTIREPWHTFRSDSSTSSWTRSIPCLLCRQFRLSVAMCIGTSVARRAWSSLFFCARRRSVSLIISLISLSSSLFQKWISCNRSPNAFVTSFWTLFVVASVSEILSIKGQFNEDLYATNIQYLSISRTSLSYVHNSCC